MKSDTKSAADISQTLRINQAPGHRKHLKRWLLLALLAIAGLTMAVAWKRLEKSNSIHYQTQKVQRGNLTVTVTATGTLEPTNQVDVGSEVSGTIETVEVDYNDRVKVGQVLARLDTSKLEAQVLKSKAALEAARAKVLETQATVNEMRDELARLRQVWELSNNKVPSQHDLDAAQAALHRAQAGEASAEAQVSEAQATLESNQTDLEKAVIRSPINGIVLKRNVEPGQTVAASLQAPVLFTLAEDLTQMRLHVAVDEADVGQVQAGQEAAFTVDAYPHRDFPARVIQVRYGSQTVGGVVTYETLLNVDNTDLSLRPGMTATAEITVEKVENAILVPNGAIRFSPPMNQKEAPADDGGILSKLLPRRPHRAPTRQSKDTPSDKRQQRVYRVQNGQLVPISIRAGATDGNMTEVTGGDVAPGMELVVDMVKVGP
jgi:HlyD family secretion protein